MKIRVPNLSDDIDVMRYSIELRNYLAAPVVAIDFSQATFAHPFALLLFASVFRDFVSTRKARGLSTVADPNLDTRIAWNTTQSYLCHVGFFKHIGLPWGNSPNTSIGNSNYIPITLLTRDELETASTSALDSIQDAIDRCARSLARIICSTDDKINMVSYCLREIVRNVFEHSRSDSCVIMAQKWQENWAEIAILDRGIGIGSSLRHLFPNLPEYLILRESLKPGISSAPSGHRVERWSNSGFGLWIASELGRRYGEFLICSNQKALLIKKGQTENSFDLDYHGTAIKLALSTQDAEYFPNILQSIVQEGEAMTETILGFRKSASKSSFIP